MNDYRDAYQFLNDGEEGLIDWLDSVHAREWREGDGDDEDPWREIVERPTRYERLAAMD
jgi:hypothetical protein